MSYSTTVTITCDGVWHSVIIGRHKFGAFGMHEGECRTGRSGNASLSADTLDTVQRAAADAGWYLDEDPDGPAQCPDCRALSPVPVEVC